MPDVDACAPHLRSLTAAPLARGAPSKSNTGRGDTPGRQNVYLAIVSELWSMVTPTPMVELSEIFCRYWPLACAGLALIRSASSACKLLLSAAASKLALPIVQWMMPALSVR